MRDNLRLLAADRREGKSTQAFAWLSHGHKVGGYPGWSRVLVVANQRMVQYHKTEYWPLLEDYDHRVYSFHEWRDARSVRHETEVCIDDLDNLITVGFGPFPGRIVAATITADPWEEHAFKAWPGSPYITDEHDPRWGGILS